LVCKLLLASAGAGKSQRIAKEALERAALGGRVLLLTYTINNQFELVRHICRLNKVQPHNVTVKGWFSFLLEDMVRPYQRCIVPERISGIILDKSGNPHLFKSSNGRRFNRPGCAEKICGECNPLHYVTKEDNRAHTYYLAKLAATINEQTRGKPARRLTELYDAVFIDEMQDLVGWDFAVIRAIVDTGDCDLDCVGDFRQAVYETSETTKKPQTSTEKISEFRDMGFKVDNLSISWRCIQSICDLADRLHAKDGLYTPTKSLVDSVPREYADHHGVFAVHAEHIGDYIKAYDPVILRWDRRTQKQLCEGRTAYNFGDSKGLSFERVLIIPTDKHAKFLSGSPTAFDGANTDDPRNKLYVGITRARYSVAFRHEGGSVISGAQIWNPGD
jgi:DNA helicase II / ATP-dependent DNA helicase PcrA